MFNEFATWIYKNGRVDHAENSNDDSLIAFAIALYHRNAATNSGESFFIAEDDTVFDARETINDTTPVKENTFDFFRISMMSFRYSSMPVMIANFIKVIFIS
jgi:hypothetical protein